MVRLHLLGDLRLEVDGSYVALASLSHKARLLLAIVATERRVHGRSELAGRLWPDVREERMATACAELVNQGHDIRQVFVASSTGGKPRVAWSV